MLKVLRQEVPLLPVNTDRQIFASNVLDPLTDTALHQRSDEDILDSGIPEAILRFRCAGVFEEVLLLLQSQLVELLGWPGHVPAKQGHQAVAAFAPALCRSAHHGLHNGNSLLTFLAHNHGIVILICVPLISQHALCNHGLVFLVLSFVSSMVCWNNLCFTVSRCFICRDLFEATSLSTCWRAAEAKLDQHRLQLPLSLTLLPWQAACPGKKEQVAPTQQAGYRRFPREKGQLLPSCCHGRVAESLEEGCFAWSRKMKHAIAKQSKMTRRIIGETWRTKGPPTQGVLMVRHVNRGSCKHDQHRK